MVKTIEAVFDGKVLLPDDPLSLEPNTRVWITIETAPPAPKTKHSFLDMAMSLNLEGPPDWSLNLESYLYDRDTGHDG